MASRTITIEAGEGPLLWGAINHALYTTRRELEIIGRARFGPISEKDRAALVKDLRGMSDEQLVAQYDGWRALVADYERLQAKFS